MLATIWPADRGVLSHDTALELHELCDINPDKIHITLPVSHQYRPRRKGGDLYVVHHATLQADEVTWHEGIRIVTPVVSIQQAIAGTVPLHLIKQAMETASDLGKVRKKQLRQLEEQLKKRK